MIVDTAEAQCVIQVLSILERSNSRYNDMFRTTKMSHTTLQAVLKGLEEKKFIKKNETDYEILDKGRTLLQALLQVQQLLK